MRYIGKGWKCLEKGRLEVPVLDAAAIFFSLLRRDFEAAGTMMFLLDIGAFWKSGPIKIDGRFGTEYVFECR